MNTPRAIERFVERQLRLLELERQAEIDETVRLARELPEDELERRGVISGYEGSKPRQVLLSEAELPRVLDAIAGGSATDEPDVPIPVAAPAPFGDDDSGGAEDLTMVGPPGPPRT